MSSNTNKEPPQQRLMSLDALRGFDMFWIIGGAELVRTLTKITKCSWDDALGVQMGHLKWEGIHFFDLIFPLFIFLAGVSIPYSISSKIEKGTSIKTVALKALKRVVLLVVLGLVYNGLLNFNFTSLRMASVLGQIGVAYGIAAFIVIFSKKPLTPLLWCIGILIIYSVIQLFIPVPGHGAGVLTREGCMNGYIDRILLPGKLQTGNFDPEGVLCMISASVLALFGAHAGRLLRMENVSGYKKTAILTGAGLLLTVAGFVLSHFYPPIKQIWTTSFNLLAGGFSLLILALFFLLIDVWKFQRWAYFFRIIGLNSITIYFAAAMIHFKYTADYLLGGTAKHCGAYSPLIIILGTITLEWLVLWFLYRKNVFLKV